MEPLGDAIRQGGKSSCIAPEGTRPLTPKLEPFKKGAFHLAMQAGVPIVPIGIHNATDVAPKNEFVMRPASVRVTVLPPVDPEKWSVRPKGSRSEEHTSEHQSQMRLSYAAFCLQKKNTRTTCEIQQS